MKLEEVPELNMNGISPMLYSNLAPIIGEFTNLDTYDKI